MSSPASSGFASTGRGRVLASSDVSTVPGNPVLRGTVLFVPEDQLPALTAAAGAARIDDLPYSAFSVTSETLTAWGARTAPVDEQGTFPLPAGDGRFVVCLADVFVDHAAGPPYSVVGCAPVAVPGHEASLTVTHGEGGVEVSLD